MDTPTNSNELNIEAPVLNVEASAANKDFGLPLLEIPSVGTADSLFGKISNGESFNLQLPKLEIGQPLEAIPMAPTQTQAPVVEAPVVQVEAPVA